MLEEPREEDLPPRAQVRLERGDAGVVAQVGRLLEQPRVEIVRVARQLGQRAGVGREQALAAALGRMAERGLRERLLALADAAEGEDEDEEDEPA